jgi:RimJ/RimL family protein N-acetyltransferase
MLVDADLVLRRYRQDDRDTLAALANNADVSRHLMERFPFPYTLEAAEGWIAKVGHEQERHNLAIQWQGRLVGGIGLEPLGDIYRQTTEIGYWLGETFWGNGLACRAVALMLGHAFSTLGFIRVQAFIDAGNGRSVRVLEKNGFVHEGTLRRKNTKNGCVHDALLYARLCD